jgi:uncharacterized protein YjaG (DUF416 family)
MFRSYNEQALIERLREIPAESRVAFALLCAERLLPSYQAFHEATGKGSFAALACISERLWKDISGERMTIEEVSAQLQACMELIPGEEDTPGSPLQVYAEDAASALAYALRARLSGESQEAVWAARRAYETLDHYVIQHDEIDPNEPQAEEHVVHHPLIQVELIRQQRDLDDLQADPAGLAGKSTKLRARAVTEGLAFLAGMGSSVHE